MVEVYSEVVEASAMSEEKDVFEYRIRFIFPGHVGPKTKRDLSEVCSRLIGGNLKLIGPDHQLTRVLTYFYVVVMSVLGCLLLDYLDQIVNRDLYLYGLQFTEAWYKNHQLAEKSIYLFFFVIMFIGIVYMAFALRKVRLIWKHRKLIRSYDPVFLEDTERDFKKFHTVEIYLYEKKAKKGWIRRS
jgi:hypothetical protein